MRKFLIHSFLLLTIFSATIILINFISEEDEYSSDYMAAIIDKHERANSIKEPKIILTGGSNVAFGIDSEELQKAFSIPVVNLALHRQLGLSFILKELKYAIKEGDIVFLCIEYFFPGEGEYKLQRHTSDYYKEAELFYSPNKYDDLKLYLEETRLKYIDLFNSENVGAKQGNPDLKDSMNPLVYSRDAFNKYGDVVGHLDKKNPGFLRGRGTVFKYRFWEGISAINEFYAYAREMNVNVFYLFPPYPSSDFSKGYDIISQLRSDLNSHLKVEILNAPEDFVYPDSDFFDTIYHLNKNGRAKRTKKLIELIANSGNVQEQIRSIKSGNHASY
ncbi:hypothetical protein QQ020_28050 [Fulvivirgaceae bacterium BMA12]|uniref:Uncharacterized protein n=1 Tax=Agaribacillus aureus TaxID=3051825 RepID=A0ABT8LEF7_9BACT|nr:hypothetical protein [Fulvivirgaceae bacterium BMA12]